MFTSSVQIFPNHSIYVQKDTEKVKSTFEKIAAKDFFEEKRLTESSLFALCETVLAESELPKQVASSTLI